VKNLSLIKRLSQRQSAVQPARIRSGGDAEDYACGYLRKQGWKLLERNYRCRRGEIDIIMRSPEMLLFVEVKFRSSTHFGHATEMVSTSKQRKIIAAAQFYLSQNPIFNQLPCRFDLFALEYDLQGELQRQWLENAFTAC